MLRWHEYVGQRGSVINVYPHDMNPKFKVELDSGIITYCDRHMMAPIPPLEQLAEAAE